MYEALYELRADIVTVKVWEPVMRKIYKNFASSVVHIVVDFSKL